MRIKKFVRHGMMISTICLFLFPFVYPVNAQNFTASVSINVEKLYSDKRQDLSGLDRSIKNYIESNRWSNGKIPFKIDVIVQIIIERIQPSFEDVYSARLYMVSTAAGFTKVDKEWQFPYRLNQPLIFGSNPFNGFTGLIDYYLYIIIGEFLDRAAYLGGEDSYKTALNIARIGQADRYNHWWDKREDFVQQYLRNSHKKFREMMFIYNTARYLQTQKNSTALKSAADSTFSLLKQVSDITEDQEFLADFFKIEYANLASIFAKDTVQYNMLIKLDPDHSEFYKNFIKKN